MSTRFRIPTLRQEPASAPWLARPTSTGLISAREWPIRGNPGFGVQFDRLGMGRVLGRFPRLPAFLRQRPLAVGDPGMPGCRIIRRTAVMDLSRGRGLLHPDAAGARELSRGRWRHAAPTCWHGASPDPGRARTRAGGSIERSFGPGSHPDAGSCQPAHSGGSARGYHKVVSRFRHPSRPAVGQHAVAWSEYLCIRSRTENARSCRRPGECGGPPFLPAMLRSARRSCRRPREGLSKARQRSAGSRSLTLLCASPAARERSRTLFPCRCARRCGQRA